MKALIVTGAASSATNAQAEKITAFLERQDLPARGIVSRLSLPDGTDCPEDALDFLTENAAGANFILFPGTASGQELSIRLAVRLSGSSLTDVTGLSAESDMLLARKPIYAGHMCGTFELRRRPYVIAVSKAESCPADEARCTVVAGYGVGSKENAAQIERLAARIPAETKASRPCAMNAWLPMERLVGVSGSMIAPQVSILLGVSGAPAFYAGIEKSRYIISVNRNPDAPVMEKSDLAVCGDCMEIFGLFVRQDGEDEQDA